MPAINKTSVAQARACMERGRREVILGEWRPSPTQPEFAIYRAKTNFVNTCNRLWQRGTDIDARAIPPVWADAWGRAGGFGDPDKASFLWAQAYARNPFGLGRGHRRVLAIELPMRVQYLDRVWSTRPVALTVADDRLEALEFTAARQPLADRLAIETMAALDLLAMRLSAEIPVRYQRHAKRVLVCDLERFEETDITLAPADLMATLAELDGLVTTLQNGHFEPTPSREGCGRCPFAGDCDFAWDSEQETAPSNASRRGH